MWGEGRWERWYLGASQREEQVLAETRGGEEALWTPFRFFAVRTAMQKGPFRVIRREGREELRLHVCWPVSTKMSLLA